jgi:S-adenosylmethionine-dependent methyltransferase
LAAPRAKIQTDKIFNGLAEKFRNNVYGTNKGWLRQEILARDLQQIPFIAQSRPVQVLDIGGGLGQMSDWFAQQGHCVTFTEPADDMRAEAEHLFQQQQAEYKAPVTSYPYRLQQLADHVEPAELVLCHAVLEWLHQPQEALPVIAHQIQPGGWLSLMFFNEDGLRFSNIVKGNYDKALKDTLDGTGQRLRLTPISPQQPEQVIEGLKQQDLEVVSVAGVRVFTDYLREKTPSEEDLEKLLTLEWRYCHQEPYWRMGRYIHVIARKPSN